jgi:hypothetical protein
MTAVVDEFVGAHEALFGRISSVVSTSHRSTKNCSCCSEPESVVRQVAREGKPQPQPLPVFLELPLCDECFAQVSRKVMEDRLHEAKRVVNLIPTKQANHARKTMLLEIIEGLIKETKGWEE